MPTHAHRSWWWVRQMGVQNGWLARIFWGAAWPLLRVGAFRRLVVSLRRESFAGCRRGRGADGRRLPMIPPSAHLYPPHLGAVALPASSGTSHGCFAAVRARRRRKPSSALPSGGQPPWLQPCHEPAAAPFAPSLRAPPARTVPAIPVTARELRPPQDAHAT